MHPPSAPHLFLYTTPPTPPIYTLSLHDALPISITSRHSFAPPSTPGRITTARARRRFMRSEDHTSELQSRFDLVCRLLLEKKKKTIQPPYLAYIKPEDVQMRSFDLLYVWNAACL